MNRSNSLNKIFDGIKVCIDVCDRLPGYDEYGDPLGLLYCKELPLANKYLKTVADDPQAISEEKILYISNHIKGCGREMKNRGCELLAEETWEVADEVVEVFAAEITKNVSA